jgi:hypothetical protein
MAHAAAVVPVPVANDTPSGPILVDTQHEDLVHDAQLDYYGCKLATCSSGTIVVAEWMIWGFDDSKFWM